MIILQKHVAPSTINVTFFYCQKFAMTLFFSLFLVRIPEVVFPSSNQMLLFLMFMEINKIW